MSAVFEETQKTNWVEKDILPVLMDPSFGPNSVSEITERLNKKNKRKGWEIKPKDLFKYITDTAVKKSEPGLRSTLPGTGKTEPNPVDILKCRINILQRNFTQTEESKKTQTTSLN